MTEGTDNATVESRLTAVETKTDRLIKDVDESRAELKELRDIVETNDKTLRNDMQAMEARLIARQDETTAVLREEIGASADSLRTQIQDTARSIRAEAQETANGLRKEMQASASGLREEMQASAKGLREEMHASAKGLREEMQASASGLREEMQGLRDDMQASAKGLREEVQASAKGLREEVQAKLLKNTKLIADTKGQLRILIAMMVPALIVTSVHLVKLVAG